MTSCLEFFGRLADKLVNNQEGIRITRAAVDPGTGGNGAANAAEPTVRKTIKMKHKKSTHHAQGRCSSKDCTRKLIFVCSVCTDATDPTQKQFWFCNPTTVEGSECFAEHVHNKHSDAHGEGGN
jgi:hypothetical protein